MVRDEAALRAAMAMTAAYLPPSGVRDPMHYSPDGSRRARGVDVWAALAFLGRDGLADLVDRCCRHAARMARGLADAGHEVLNEVGAQPGAGRLRRRRAHRARRSPRCRRPACAGAAARAGRDARRCGSACRPTPRPRPTSRRRWPRSSPAPAAASGGPAMTQRHVDRRVGLTGRGFARLPAADMRAWLGADALTGLGGLRRQLGRPRHRRVHGRRRPLPAAPLRLLRDGRTRGRRGSRTGRTTRASATTR